MSATDHRPASQPAQPVLNVADLEVHYGSRRRRRRALNRVS